MMGLLPAVKSKLSKSLSAGQQNNNNNIPDRRHTYNDRTKSESDADILLKDKRCMSMPSVASSQTASSSTLSSSHAPLSRMLRLQDRRFHQKFVKVHPDEQLLNYFSCALLQDRLLHQGNLYITDNYFAFYSNIFGHKKSILIPLSDVVKVTKEKTAKIIPNAVGVYTEKEKYIFGSLLSRDTAFRVIQQTWIRSTDAGLGLHEDSENEPSIILMCPGEEDSSVSSGVSGHLTSDEASHSMTSDASPQSSTKSPEMTTSAAQSIHNEPSKEQLPLSTPKKCSCTLKDCLMKIEELVISLSELPRMTLLYVISVALIILLLFSACVLFYRINLVHQRLPSQEQCYLDSINKYNQAEAVIGRDVELQMMLRNVQERVRHISLIRNAINELLTTAAAELHQLSKSPAD